MTRIERLEYYRRVLGEAADKSAEHLRIARRKLAQTDLFFLMIFVLRRKDTNKATSCLERCVEIITILPTVSWTSGAENTINQPS